MTDRCIGEIGDPQNAPIFPIDHFSQLVIVQQGMHGGMGQKWRMDRSPISHFHRSGFGTAMPRSSASVVARAGWCHWLRNPLEPYLYFEIIRGLEALLGSLSFLAPPGPGWMFSLSISQNK